MSPTHSINARVPHSIWGEHSTSSCCIHYGYRIQGSLDWFLEGCLFGQYIMHSFGYPPIGVQAIRTTQPVKNHRVLGPWHTTTRGSAQAEPSGCDPERYGQTMGGPVWRSNRSSSLRNACKDARSDGWGEMVLLF